jgi:biotin synthase
LANAADIDPFDFVRMIAVARITMPKARVRLSAGRQQMDDTMQALCFIAGANSIFYGEKLLTTGNPDVENDRALLKRLGMNSTGIASDYTGGLRSTEELLSPDTCGHKQAHDAEHGHEHSASCSHA